MTYPRQPSAYLNDDHDAFRAAVAAFVAREMRPHAQEWETAGVFPRDLYVRAAQAELLGLRYEPQWGGSGLDYFATVVLCEELAKCDSIGTAVGLMAQSEFALSAIADEASHELKAAYLAPAIRGELIGAIGVSEPGAGSDVASIATWARRDGDEYVISGQKTFISNGTRADFLTLAVRTGKPGPHGISLVVFPTDTPGFSVGRRLDKLGARASDTGELFFDNCRIPAANLVGEEGWGFRYILSHFAGERLVIAAFAVGAMEHLITIGLDYARTRRAFGRALWDFQAWRHRFAQMTTRLEATRLLTYQAADLLNRRDPAAEVAVSMAKLAAAEAAQFVAAEVLQLHGGFGQMEESPVPRYYRDVAGFSVGAGTSEIMRELIARALDRAREKS
ncbi:MAG: acyl-CoA dehydrogenase family protein [Mycobacterium pseudokansasii]|uniref:acyl-CoA dehydrogenase family protein n=1 Tax=Mycobacterium pseudokansasii TaxID=2341080 RepID=UPI0023F14B5B|nr:acyl-CoA dehydrogenase family protein [Mycobacterium pseudokansasii]MBY0390561.1 acyl-CoA dehydrogenase family protein [Mycobacterium pseudokansasii]